ACSPLSFVRKTIASTRVPDALYVGGDRFATFSRPDQPPDQRKLRRAPHPLHPRHHEPPSSDAAGLADHGGTGHSGPVWEPAAGGLSGTPEPPLGQRCLAGQHRTELSDHTWTILPRLWLVGPEPGGSCLAGRTSTAPPEWTAAGHSRPQRVGRVRRLHALEGVRLPVSGDDFHDDAVAGWIRSGAGRPG